MKLFSVIAIIVSVVCVSLPVCLCALSCLKKRSSTSRCMLPYMAIVLFFRDDADEAIRYLLPVNLCMTSCWQIMVTYIYNKHAESNSPGAASERSLIYRPTIDCLVKFCVQVLWVFCICIICIRSIQAETYIRYGTNSRTWRILHHPCSRYTLEPGYTGTAVHKMWMFWTALLLRRMIK